MKTAQYSKMIFEIVIFAAVVFCFFVTAPVSVLAEDEDISYFENPAQAQKAINVAEAAAIEDDDAVNQAISDLAEAQASGDDAAIAAAEAALEDARTNAIASVSDQDLADIADMRDEGMGWGQIAQAYGVHPSVLGLGNKFGHTHQNRAKADFSEDYGNNAATMSSTARDMKTGGAKNFGQSKAGKDKGVSNAGGLGKGKGIGGGIGGGKGGGKGGGQGGGKGGGKGKD